MVQGKEENGKLIITLSGVIDSSNAGQAESQIQELRMKYDGRPIELDCDHLDYSTSAGLRVILRLKQQVDDTVLVNVHPDLYNILDMTGMTDIMDVQKAYRVFSVEGCEVIGQGANGKVYRIDPDTIVKVYMNPEALPEIHRERKLARLAFVAGIPTAIPYDVVRIEGGGYGSVFELLNARSFAKLLISGEKTLDEIAEMSISLLRLIHSKQVDSEILPDMKETAVNWVEFLKDYLPPEYAEKLRLLVSSVPDDPHLIHGDYHLKNIMFQNGEILLIDFDTLCHGHPIFELASMYNAYLGFGLFNHDAVMDFIGIPYETSRQFWRKSLELYLGTKDETKINDVETKSKILGLTRLMRREIRRNALNREDGRKKVEMYGEEITNLLTQVDTLVF